MKTFIPLFLSFWFSIGLISVNAYAVPGSPLPGESLYNLTTPLIDQDARAQNLADSRGKVVVISLFYTSCPYMCPLIIDTLRQSERALDDVERANLSVLLVSLDAKRDGPAELKAQFERRKLDASRWTLARSEAPAVRKLAAALGIQYRELPDGEFSHASVLVLLDREGRIVARTETMGKTDPDFIAALKKQLAEP